MGGGGECGSEKGREKERRGERELKRERERNIKIVRETERERSTLGFISCRVVTRKYPACTPLVY